MAITFPRGDAANVVSAQSVTPAAGSPPRPIEGVARPGSPQAAEVVAAQRVFAAKVLRDLYEYLRANVEAHPALAPAIPAMSQAVAEYRAGTEVDPFHGARQVYPVIQQARQPARGIREACRACRSARPRGARSG